MSRFTASRRPAVAPLGNVGNALQTPAAQATFRMPSTFAAAGIRQKPRRSRRRRARGKVRRLVKRVRKTGNARRRGSYKRAYMVKGSSAAKRHMAALRKLRRKRRS